MSTSIEQSAVLSGRRDASGGIATPCPGPVSEIGESKTPDRVSIEEYYRDDPANYMAMAEVRFPD